MRIYGCGLSLYQSWRASCGASRADLVWGIVGENVTGLQCGVRVG